MDAVKWPEWRVINADCRAALAEVADGSVHMVMTDPPYGHNQSDGDLATHLKKAMGDKDAPEHRRPILNDGFDEANEVFEYALRECPRILVPVAVAAFCCNGGGGVGPQFARWGLKIDEVLGFKHGVVWDKGPGGLGWHYRRQYEMVLIGQKAGAPCRWFDTTMNVGNVIRPGEQGIRRLIPSATDHPTPKPWQLAALFLRKHTLPGDLVVDPFAGAGWVGEACLRLGRRYLGIELDPYWAGVAQKRLRGIVEAEALWS